MNDDLISRQAAIDAIYGCYIGGKDAIKNAPINDLYADGLTEAVDAVWDMPSVTPQAGWIPCAERLPEDYEDVLVCDGVDMFVGWCEFDGTSKKWHSLDDNFEYDTPIIAWMPLPEPYKAED